MRVYLASANNQQQAEHVSNMSVLLSFAAWKPWLYKYQQCFSRILIDSGAYSEFNTGKQVDISQYKDWSQQWIGTADAVAGLDDIRGNYNRSLQNYAAIPWSFPTWHDSDPIDLLPELVAMAIERRTWLGIGFVPPRSGKEKILRQAL